jgi:hypothetical protein
MSTCLRAGSDAAHLLLLMMVMMLVKLMLLLMMMIMMVKIKMLVTMMMMNTTTVLNCCCQLTEAVSSVVLPSAVVNNAALAHVFALPIFGAFAPFAGVSAKGGSKEAGEAGLGGRVGGEGHTSPLANVILPRSTLRPTL